MLQEKIDHGFKQGNVFMVLCGSNQGFMESEVLQEKSPLYGRRTGQIHLAPFDCFDAARMVPGIDHEQALRYYASFPDAGITGITCCSPITPSVREPVRRRGRTPI